MEVLKKRGVGTMARMGWAWAQDAVKTSLGGKPGYILAASTRPEDFALMEAEKFVIDGWHALEPKAVVVGFLPTPSSCFQNPRLEYCRPRADSKPLPLVCDILKHPIGT